MSDFVIRSASPADAARLAALHGRCFSDEPWNAAAFAELLAVPGARGFLEEDAAGVRGLILLRQAADEVEVVTLAVDAGWRRRGLAGRLLRHGLAAAQAMGARRAFLEVAEDNAAARRLYEAAGFALCGRRPGYYRRKEGPPRDAVVLAAALALPGSSAPRR